MADSNLPPKPSIARAHVFFDGQNLYHSAKECFDYPFPNYDPIKLAEAITSLTPGRRLEKIHFYTGVHDIRHDPFWHAFWSNKLALLPTKGVNVVTRKLKYSDVPIPMESGGTKVIKVGREKGIDLRLGLDLVRLARKGEYDAAIIFSQDTDLEEAVNEVYDIRQEFKLWLWLECAFPISPTAKNLRGISRTQWRTIDKSLYDRCIDPRDYRP